ncbi:Ig-like domain-containing protein [Candidatus Amarolinea aalborgensis]|uniref:Ig-like domain-containing protein n=1 Tax=Candidatus Amarolinea aalborgensis TaxID=2249329 RepID=UPI003BFA15B9
MFRQRGWYWTPLFDRWQVLAALLLAVLFIVLVTRVNPAPAPVFTSPTANAQLAADGLGDAAGTARANQNIRLFDADSAIGNTQADAQGNWRLPLPALTSGQHTLFARVVDNGGKVLASSGPLNITVLPATAATPTPAVVVPTITSPAPGAQLTVGSLGDLAGAGRPGDTLHIFDGNTDLGAVTVSPDGTWRFPFPALGSGSHVITARAVAANGNLLAASVPLNISIVDAATATPTVVIPTITSPAPGAQLTAGSLGDLAGAGRPGDTLRIFDGNTDLGAATIGPDGAWRFPFPALGSGSHVITARVVDASGNTLATSQPLNITIVDAASPTPTAGAPGTTPGATPGAGGTPGATPGAGGTPGTTPGAGGTPGTTPGAGGTPGTTPGAGGTPGTTPGAGGTPGTTPGAGGTPGATPSAGGTPGATPGTTPGATPAATPTPVGTPSSGRVKAPTLTSPLVSPLHTSRPLFAGTAEPGVKVRLYDGDKLLGEVTTDATGNWSFVPPAALTVGDHVLRLAAVDADGSEVFADPLPFTIAADAQPAAPPTINLPPGGQLPAGERLTGAAPPNSTVTIYAGRKALGTAQVGPDGAWQFIVPADLTPGDYDFKVAANDASGNLLGESLPVRIKILPPVGLPTTGGDLSGE